MIEWDLLQSFFDEVARKQKNLELSRAELTELRDRANSCIQAPLTPEFIIKFFYNRTDSLLAFHIRSLSPTDRDIYLSLSLVAVAFDGQVSPAEEVYISQLFGLLAFNVKEMESILGRLPKREEALKSFKKMAREERYLFLFFLLEALSADAGLAPKELKLLEAFHHETDHLPFTDQEKVHVLLVLCERLLVAKNITGESRKIAHSLLNNYIQKYQISRAFFEKALGLALCDCLMSKQIQEVDPILLSEIASQLPYTPGDKDQIVEAMVFAGFDSGHRRILFERMAIFLTEIFLPISGGYRVSFLNHIARVRAGQ